MYYENLCEFGHADTELNMFGAKVKVVQVPNLAIDLVVLEYLLKSVASP